MLLKPLERFFQIEAASGIVLLLATVIALVWANSPGAEAYGHLWHAQLTLGAGSGLSLHFLINEVLMAVFFLVVGLEIRREMNDGALASLKLAALPLAAALGGIVVPALIYLAFNPDPPLRQGWAVPMATDIAFAVGVLALLGKRVPAALRVLLLALAVIDDIAAILVIAFFYSEGVVLSGLFVAALGSVGVWIMQRWQVPTTLVFLLPGALIWYGLFQAGVHPTLAGVVVGLMTPVNAAARAETALHPWVAYGVMPLFAFANAGVSFEGLDFGSTTSLALTTGIVVGLAVGKPLGIVLSSALAIRMGWCALPPGAKWSGVWVVGCLGGIGFTMSIFIATLAFADATTLAVAKFAVLAASTLAAVVGLTLGSMLLPRKL